MFSAALSELRRLGVAGDIDSREPHAAQTSDVPPLRPMWGRTSTPGVQQLRDVLLDWVSQNGDAECAGLTIRQWVEFETGETLSSYERRLRRPAQWGGVVELYALTQCFRITVSVWEPAGSDGSFARRHKLSAASAAPSKRPGAARSPSAHLFYNGVNHYNVFVPDEPEQEPEPEPEPDTETQEQSGPAQSHVSVAITEVQPSKDVVAAGLGADRITKPRSARQNGLAGPAAKKAHSNASSLRKVGAHTKQVTKHQAPPVIKQNAPPPSVPPHRKLSDQRRGRAGLLGSGKLHAVLSFRLDSPRRSVRPTPRVHEVRV